MISGKENSIRSLSETALQLMDSGDADQALRLIYNVVERVITEPLCVSQVFGSRVLDDLCQRIGRLNLDEIKLGNKKATLDHVDSSVSVYIVTKLQKSGGHTRVIEDFIKAQPHGRHIILSTELVGRSDSDYLLAALATQVDIVFESAPKLDYQQRLTWLQQRLLNINPGKIYLFNHHQDSVAVAAIQPEMNFDASFYHHGDHHLCLGVYLPHLKHIDPHPMGYHNCRNVLGVDNVYVPLTVDDKGVRPSEWSFLDNGSLTTCTAARSNKVEVPYFTSYADVVPRLLKVTGGRHIHIGRLTPWALYKIRRGLIRHGVQSDRFVYIPWVPSVWKALHNYRVDLYIASFPYGGGLTLIEAMGAGIPVALHRHIFSRVLSGVELAYSGAFSWRSPDELLDYCASVTEIDLNEAGRLGRMQYVKYHSQDGCLRFIDGVVCDCEPPDNMSALFTVESDEWALWVERQINIRRIVSRVIYRAFRRFRAWWFSKH